MYINSSRELLPELRYSTSAFTPFATSLSKTSFDQNTEIRYLCLSFLLCSLPILSQPQQL